MSIWKGRLVKKKKRSPEELKQTAEQRLARLEKQNGEDPWEGFDDEEITGLIDVALEKVRSTTDAAAERLSNATEELKKQAGELKKLGSDPPARKPA